MTWSPEALANFRAIHFKRRRPIAERYWEKVDKRGPDDCWEWLGSRHGDGYGLIGGENGVCTRAHRVGWVLAGNELPPSVQRGAGRIVIDHLCKNRACQNTAHMRLTTQKRNTTENSNSVYAKNAQKEFCNDGHPFSGANLAIAPSRFFKAPGRVTTTRACLTCQPQLWMYAVIERPGPPRARVKWRGPFVPEEKK